MELTNEILEKNGFQTNHPDFVLNKYKKHNDKPEWCITLERDYVPLTNVLGYKLMAWNTNDKGVITKRIQFSMVNTVEEVNEALALCHLEEQQLKF